MTLSDKQWEFLQDVSSLILYAQRKGYKLTGGELWRTKEQQKIHFEAGRSKTMSSNHLNRLAIDLNLFIDGKPIWEFTQEWEDLGVYWESIRDDNRWGGHYKTFMDLPHFERVA